MTWQYIAAFVFYSDDVCMVRHIRFQCSATPENHGSPKHFRYFDSGTHVSKAPFLETGALQAFGLPSQSLNDLRLHAMGAVFTMRTKNHDAKRKTECTCMCKLQSRVQEYIVV